MTEEPPDHIEAKKIVAEWVAKVNWFAIFEYPLWVWQKEDIVLMRGRRESYLHHYDVVCFYANAYIVDDDGKKVMLQHFANMSHKDLLRNKYKKQLDSKIIMIVEVDDPDLHAKEIHRINDGVAKSFAAWAFPQAIFVRLNKDLINQAPPWRDSYLYDNLGF